MLEEEGEGSPEPLSLSLSPPLWDDQGIFVSSCGRKVSALRLKPRYKLLSCCCLDRAAGFKGTVETSYGALTIVLLPLQFAFSSVHVEHCWPLTLGPREPQVGFYTFLNFYFILSLLLLFARDSCLPTEQRRWKRSAGRRQRSDDLEQREQLFPASGQLELNVQFVLRSTPSSVLFHILQKRNASQFLFFSFFCCKLILYCSLFTNLGVI